MTLCLVSAADAYPITPLLRSMPASPLECAHPKNVSASPLKCALAKSLDLNPPGMNSYKNTGGSPHLAKQEKGASSFPASVPPCFLLRGRLECASILLWAAFAEGGEGSSGKMQRQACLAIIFLAGLAMGFQMTTGELEAQDRGQARSMAISRYGIVAAESPLAAQAGVAVLGRGGRAGDGALAANALIGLGPPMSNCIRRGPGSLLFGR